MSSSVDHLTQHVECLIFASQQPISIKDIHLCLEERFEAKINKDDLMNSIEQIRAKYQNEKFSFELLEISGGYQFLTKPLYFETIATHLKLTTKKKLSKAALETLAMIAYKQPVTKVEVEKIRGVSCDYSIQKLLDKELVSIVGRGDGAGKPLIYSTTEKFMDYFGIKSVDELPKPKEFKNADQEIGEAAPIEIQENAALESPPAPEMESIE